LPERIADSHIHICAEDWRFGIDLVFTWDDLNGMFSSGKIDRASVMPMLSNTDDSLDVNKTFFENLMKCPDRDRVWAYYWPHPAEVDSEFASEKPVAGIKYHPSISQIRIDNAPDVIRVARDNGLPLLVHCGRNVMSRIEPLLTARRREPSITFIAAHLGGLANELILAALDRIGSLANLDNLYLETSGCMNPRILRRAVDVMGADRILWGTDTPFFDHDVSRIVLERTGLEKGEIRKILYDNAIQVHRRT
jgi:predicted TIM-barrel fold metal-dependent hydrolase